MPAPKLFYPGGQTASTSGRDTVQMLSVTGLLDLCLTLSSGYIEHWLERPETYPEEFKTHVVAIWRSNDGVNIPCLVWNITTKRVGIEHRPFGLLKGKVPTLRVM